MSAPITKISDVRKRNIEELITEINKCDRNKVRRMVVLIHEIKGNNDDILRVEHSNVSIHDIYGMFEVAKQNLFYQSTLGEE